MEMETSAMPPKAPRPTVEEDELASQVLEIIGGITLAALQSLEEPGERDVWLMEEGDDSVFYSDEDITANTSRGFGANECEHLVDDPGEESIIDEEIAELEKDVTQQVILTEREEERQKLLTPKTEPMDQSDPGARSDLTPEKLVSTCGESLNMQTQQNTSAGKANLPVEKEEVIPNLGPFNKEGHTRLNREADVPEQNSSADLQISRDRWQHQVEPQPDHNIHQIPRPVYSTLPLPKKSCDGAAGQQESFNHLSSSKYSTVSYRKIRRGNTRQKIDDFEYMIMKL
ncbi:uncharacterized protein LOC119500524 [Sebastes umbrosus]|uniref:uncharacterized protein LOC119500524 n=1 Tax=Sebastes umbrosus TaxID=72105 RepID=UPI00189FAFA9|nr:uncharacterized protein LOC119500524 [Sebastes umbrosus]